MPELSKAPLHNGLSAPLPPAEAPSTRLSPPNVSALLDISLPGPPEDVLSQGEPATQISDSIIEIAISSGQYGEALPPGPLPACRPSALLGLERLHLRGSTGGRGPDRTRACGGLVGLLAAGTEQALQPSAAGRSCWAAFSFLKLGRRLWGCQLSGTVQRWQWHGWCGLVSTRLWAGHRLT